MPETGNVRTAPPLLPSPPPTGGAFLRPVFSCRRFLRCCVSYPSSPLSVRCWRRPFPSTARAETGAGGRPMMPITFCRAQATGKTIVVDVYADWCPDLPRAGPRSSMNCARNLQARRIAFIKVGLRQTESLPARAPYPAPVNRAGVQGAARKSPAQSPRPTATVFAPSCWARFEQFPAMTSGLLLFALPCGVGDHPQSLRTAARYRFSSARRWAQPCRAAGIGRRTGNQFHHFRLRRDCLRPCAGIDEGFGAPSGGCAANGGGRSGLLGCHGRKPRSTRPRLR